MIPKLQITLNGYIAPTTEQINLGVWRDWESALGGNLSKAQGAPQYQIITSETAIIKDSHDALIELANQFDPRYAEGIFQDAIGWLYDISRSLATRSLCQVTFSGLSGVQIPSGFQVQDLSGRLWETTGAYNIGQNGKVTGTVRCLTVGAIEALPNSIVVIPTSLNGVDSVTNEDTALVGTNEESRVDFEMKRQESLEKNAKMTDGAVRGEVLAVRDVVDCFVQSNYTDSTITVGSTNYPLIRNSICVSVVGGNDYDVAYAALLKGGTGCSWNGNTPITVYDKTFEGVQPFYDIKILRPTLVDCYIQITVIDKDKITVQNEIDVKNHILSGVKSGQYKSRINSVFIPAVFMCGVPEIGVISIKASTDKINWVDKISVGIDQFLVFNEFRIEIVQA